MITRSVSPSSWGFELINSQRTLFVNRNRGLRELHFQKLNEPDRGGITTHCDPSDLDH